MSRWTKQRKKQRQVDQALTDSLKNADCYLARLCAYSHLRELQKGVMTPNGNKIEFPTNEDMERAKGRAKFSEVDNFLYGRMQAELNRILKDSNGVIWE